MMALRLRRTQGTPDLEREARGLVRITGGRASDTRRMDRPMRLRNFGSDYCGRLAFPLRWRSLDGWRLWAYGLRDAMTQRGIIGAGRTIDGDWGRQEDYDCGLSFGEWIARRVYG